LTYLNLEGNMIGDDWKKVLREAAEERDVGLSL